MYFESPKRAANTTLLAMETGSVHVIYISHRIRVKFNLEKKAVSWRAQGTHMPDGPLKIKLLFNTFFHSLFFGAQWLVAHTIAPELGMLGETNRRAIFIYFFFQVATYSHLSNEYDFTDCPKWRYKKVIGNLCWINEYSCHTRMWGVCSVQCAVPFACIQQ